MCVCRCSCRSCRRRVARSRRPAQRFPSPPPPAIPSLTRRCPLPTGRTTRWGRGATTARHPSPLPPSTSNTGSISWQGDLRRRFVIVKRGRASRLVHRAILIGPLIAAKIVLKKFAKFVFEKKKKKVCRSVLFCISYSKYEPATRRNITEK